MCARRIVLELTTEKVTGCRERPSLRFMAALAEAERGDYVILVADEDIIPSDIALASFKEEGFSVKSFERSLWRYRIEAVKEG
ncbi:MAG: hypothetical protein LRS46_03850 [Desulfurococcales archaeon]|nr:hypothetical protein [Desulfurococcales archaeon]